MTLRARNLMDLQSMIQGLNYKHVTIPFLSNSLSRQADVGCAFQTLQLQMLGLFSRLRSWGGFHIVDLLALSTDFLNAAVRLSYVRLMRQKHLNLARLQED